MFRRTIFCFTMMALWFVIFLLSAMPSMGAEAGKEKPFQDTKKSIVDPVRIESGLVSGKLINESGEAVRAYLGIPYAAPPVGDLRWKPPQPVIPWSGVRDATQYSKSAPPGLGSSLDLPLDEDCLYLNVITPAKYANEKLPVMVWLHPGAYSAGSGNMTLFNGYRLPQAGVIVVTVNTRLGVFGLLAHPLLSGESSRGVSGNYLFMDILASLEWVKQNIAVFGGDPDNVTIFGQSGGGYKVAAIVASPLSKGLFKRAICQSGPGMPGISLADLEKTGENLFAKLGVTTLEEARQIPWKDIVDADKDLKTNAVWNMAIDGWFISDNPEGVFSAGEQNAVQMIVGLNQGELSPKQSAAYFISGYVNMLSGIRKKGTEGYAYIFDQVPENWREKGGVAFHGMDNSYIFGDYDNRSSDDWSMSYQMETLYGVGPEDKEPALSEADKKVSEAMMAMWAQFARTGNPSVKGLITVPAWAPDSDKYLYLADPLQIKSGFSKIPSTLENIAGTWRGKLVTGPGEEIVIQFKIIQNPSGSYSAVLNSPDANILKNVSASPVIYDSGTLKLDVAGLGCSFEGTVKEGEINGKWLQKGVSYPLILSPYDKPQLSKKDMGKLLGTWLGKPSFPEVLQGMGNMPGLVFRFEMTETDEFAGFLDIPDEGMSGTPVTNIEMNDGVLSFNMPDPVSWEFTGNLMGEEIVGKLKMSGPSFPLKLKKGEYTAPVYKLNLPKETVDQLLGNWNGKLGPLTAVYRFEKTENGDFVGFLDSPDQGVSGIQFTEVGLNGGKLVLKVKSIDGEFKGELSGDKLAGEWTQRGMSTPLTLTKERP